jgi:PiT family inorganic phosphate transporter
VGATKRLTAVRWGIAGEIVWAWILTIPLAAALSAVLFLLLNLVI